MRSLWKLCLRSKKIWRSLKLIVLLSVSLLCLSLLFNLTLKLPHNANRPVDAFLILGGSISREIYVAKLAKQYPDIPILISQGSPDPCIVLIFQREQARLTNVWLEKCANSTFGNFWFGLAILNSWHVHKVKLITSASHLPRAEWLGRIFLNSHGIGVELDIVPEQGVPGNREFLLKTRIDLARSLLWALLSQVIQPSCLEVTELVAVDLKSWQEKGFKCERQAELSKLIN